MSMDSGIDPDKINESSKESMEKLHSLVNQLKAVEEHEQKILAEEEPPLFRHVAAPKL